MESKQDAELLNVAIPKLVEEKRKDHNPDDKSAEDELSLSKLLSEMESLKQEGRIEGRDGDEEEDPVNANAGEPQTQSGIGNEGSKERDDGSREVMATEEIVKELRHVRRQNTITHCLLSIMIVLTVAWQLSEVSLIFKVKEGISHPFRSFGSMITGMFKPKVAAITDHNNGDRDRDSNGEEPPTLMSNFSHTEQPQLPPLKMPELPHFDIPDIGINGKND